MGKKILRLLMTILFSFNLASPGLAAAKKTEITFDDYNRFSGEIRDQINERVAMELFYRYSQVKTSKDFENFFLKRFDAKERDAMIAEYFPLKRLPGLTRFRNVLTLTVDGSKIDFEISNPYANEFKINGNKWNYSTRISMVKNARNLEAFLQKKHASLLQRLLMPEAQAEPISITAIGVTVLVTVLTAMAVNALSGVGSMAWDAVCQTAQQKFNKDLREYAGACTDWYKRRDERLRGKGIFQNGDSYRLAAEAKERNEIYELDILPCPAGKPSKDSKEEIVLKNKIRRSSQNPELIPAKPLPAGNIMDKQEKPAGEPLATGTIPEKTPATPDKATLQAWNRVAVKLRPNLNVADITITPEDVDPTSKAAETNILFKIAYNDDGSIAKVGLRNSLYRPDDGSSPIVWISGEDATERLDLNKSSTADEANLTARVQRANEMAKYILDRAKECSIRTASGAAKVPELSEKVLTVPAVVPEAPAGDKGGAK